MRMVQNEAELRKLIRGNPFPKMLNYTTKFCSQNPRFPLLAPKKLRLRR